MFYGAQWGRVIPFAPENGGELAPEIMPAPYRYGSSDFERDAQDLVQTAHIGSQIYGRSTFQSRIDTSKITWRAAEAGYG
jgi:hypothetical protein